MTTEKTLDAINDAGLFEKLATAVLREADQRYEPAIHSGVNVEGRTIKSPVDGICFIHGDTLIAVHHTICSERDLEHKWLHDPSQVKPRKKGGKPTAPSGDLIKTAEIVDKERKDRPRMSAILVLTTNKEPSPDLVTKVQSVGQKRRIEVDIWSRSRIAHFLDNKPLGQWLRYKHLGIDQELLSSELFQQLCQRSWELRPILDNRSNAWIHRELDDALKAGLTKDVTFLVAASGLGKSVACHRLLVENAEKGRFGIVLPEDLVEKAITLEDAVTSCLGKLHSKLNVYGSSWESFCSHDNPLLIVVEDISRSGQARQIISKLASWSHKWGRDEDANHLPRWRLICPVWPEHIQSFEKSLQDTVDKLTLIANGFSEEEGVEAVLKRSNLSEELNTKLQAREISQLLNHDPLLISLHTTGSAQHPHRIISDYIEQSISAAALSDENSVSSDYRDAIHVFAVEMLRRRDINPSWIDLQNWASLNGDQIRLLNKLAKNGKLFGLTGHSSDQRLVFRHDRVRDGILAESIVKLSRQNILKDDLAEEPYYAEILGIAVTLEESNDTLIRQLARCNPLSLVYALRLLGNNSHSNRHRILDEIKSWLDESATHSKANCYKLYEAQRMLAETSASEVPKLVYQFRDLDYNGMFALLRNGDFMGGVMFCKSIHPGIGYGLRDFVFEHAKSVHISKLVAGLSDYLQKSDINKHDRRGALVMAGHLASHRLLDLK